MKKIIPAFVFLALWACNVVAQDGSPPGTVALAASESRSSTTSTSVWPNESELSKIREGFEYSGSIECATCHVAAQPGYRIKMVTDFVLLSEFQIWLNDDPHARAYLNIIPDRSHFDAVTKRRNALNEMVDQAARANGMEPKLVEAPTWEDSSNERSLNILMKVGNATREEVEQLFEAMTDRSDFLVTDPRATKNPNKLIGTVKLCMSCHAGWDNRQISFDTEVVEFGTGVSCEGCHGASSGWLEDHKKPEWRLKNPAEKQKQGLHNTRQPIARSKQCFACHIGDQKQGKVVTHEMYAAGHPPLPSIEIESFADQIPRHWRYLGEKKDFEFAGEFKQKFGADLGLIDEAGQPAAWADTEFPRTKNLLVAGVMASAQSVELLADSAGHAMLAQKNNPAESRWPEFSVFDCAACHHDLKAEGWERGFAGIPGRPPVPYWPSTLSKLGITFLNAKQQGRLFEDYKANQKRLQDVLDRQPFGDPTELAVVGQEYSQWLETIVAQRIQSSRLTRDDAIDVLQQLLRDTQDSNFNAKDEIWDFHSARQLGWAISLIYSEITEVPMRNGEKIANASAAVKDAMDRLYAVKREPFIPANEFEVTLEAMRKELLLDLAPVGKITTQQAMFLDTWRNFDRKRFIQLLSQLRIASQTGEWFNLK